MCPGRVNMSPTALVAHLISRQSAATLCLSVLGPQPVSTVEGFPTQGGRACLGAGLAVPNPASSRRWPSVRDPCGEPSLGLADPPLARRSPGCGASPVLALAPPRGDVAREAGTAAVAPDQGERSGNGSLWRLCQGGARPGSTIGEALSVSLGPCSSRA